MDLGAQYAFNKTIKNWMLKNHESHIDPQTGILCMTTLAEECANALFNEAANDIEFEMAHEVGEELELLGD